MNPLGARFLERTLLPGDILLYSGTSLFSKLIQIKTSSDITHAELFLGEGKCVASRDGKGVEVYPIRWNDLILVMRPISLDLDMKAGWRWFTTSANPTGKPIRGQGYDWWGLLRFFRIGKTNMTKQFCFELVTRYLRACGFEPFAPAFDADLISGNHFLTTPSLQTWWKLKRQ
jgi:hypothetical protein